MPLYGMGFNEQRQIKESEECAIHYPVLLNVDPTKKLKSVVIFWSRIFVIMEDHHSNNELLSYNSCQKDFTYDSCNIVSCCFNSLITFNSVNKKLVLWSSDLKNSKVISCDGSESERLTIDGIYSTKDNTSLIFLTPFGTLFRSKTSLKEMNETSTIFIEHFYLKPDKPLLIKVKQVSCGNHHTLVLTNVGLVFSFGIGNQGQLGIGSIESREEPAVVESLEGLFISEVSAGGWHSLALTDSGDIYVWGWNNFGQLGLPSSNHKESNSDRANSTAVSIQAYPICLDIQISKDFNSHDNAPKMDNIQECVCFIKVASGSRHSLAISSLGDVYSWGWNKYGQLGYRSTELNDSPRKLDLPLGEKAVRIFAGYWNSIVETENAKK